MIPSETLDDIRSRLAGRAEEVCKLLLPGGKRMGKKWKCGDISGNPGSSLEVELEGPKAGVWNDSAAGSGGNLLTLWQECRGVSFLESVSQAAEFTRVSLPEKSARRKAPLKEDYQYFDPDPEPVRPADVTPRRRKRSEADAGPAIDWDAAVTAVTTNDLYKLTGWRGYGLEFAEWLKAEKHIGMIGGNWAIPVRDELGNVICAHVRMEDGNWMYQPKGISTAPLVIGNPAKASTTFLMESQWDAFAVLDRLDHHKAPDYYAAIITRGATPKEETDLHLAGAQLVVAISQNDPREKTKNGVTKPNVNKEGRTPSEDWLFRVRKMVPDSIDFRAASTPTGFKDVNDWTLEKNPERREVEEVCITHARSPDIRPFLTIRQLLDYPVDDDPNCLIGKRYLCRGGSLVLVGPSGAGKSTLMASMALHFAVAAPWCGMKPVRPLRQLIVQAENDDGDIAEMTKGALQGVRHEWSKDQFKLANENIRFCRITSEVGEEFCKTLERQIRFHKAEVVWADPLLSFVGGDISKQDVASEFFREWLNPVLERTGAVICFLHHTGKPSSDSKSRQHWSNADFSYLGFGSSEITNWARAVVILSETKEHKTYKMIFAKRGNRAGAKDMRGDPTDVLYLRQGRPDEGLTWSQCEAPEEEEEPQRGGGGKPKEDLMSTLRLIEWPCRWLDAIKLLQEHPLGPKSEAAAKTLMGKAIRNKNILAIGKGLYEPNQFL